jgi:hypothetical protein
MKMSNKREPPNIRLRRINFELNGKRRTPSKTPTERDRREGEKSVKGGNPSSPRASVFAMLRRDRSTRQANPGSRLRGSKLRDGGVND